MDKARKILLTNKKIGRDYEVLEKFEAGISLLGQEVKSLKIGAGTLGDSFVAIEGDEAFLIRVHIPPYQPKNSPDSYDPDRRRKLLLNKKEIRRMAAEVKEKALTIVPYSVYIRGKNIKAELALVRGKKKYDKRQTIKKRDIERDLGRRLKN